MFNLAELWGLRPAGTNPRRHIKKYPEKKRERYYSAGELQAIGRVLAEMEDEHIELPSAIAAVRLLLFTGLVAILEHISPTSSRFGNACVDELDLKTHAFMTYGIRLPRSQLATG